MQGLRDLFTEKKAIIGMVHLPPLPGSPRCKNGMTEIVDAALADAIALVQGGVSAVLIENFGDTPFYPEHVPAETVAAMTAVTQILQKNVEVPLGINVLRNDGYSAMAIAHATNACFIRVNVLAGSAITDQGMISSRAHDILRLRKNLSADVKILADVYVKHASPLGEVPIEQAAHELIERALADAVVVTGSATGAQIDLDNLQMLRKALPDCSLVAGSGVTSESVQEVFQYTDAAIVGTYFKNDGDVSKPVQQDRVRALMSKLNI
ncbi:MAG: BtpA/SgcQ family protein [Deferribacteres bacterium]|nr:BtpA/SgcQ family protein [candidate division KSB1 bacterium]MCB9510595.1 BtpA/SgcQ family protein [Deferribacteres bacterium]